MKKKLPAIVPTDSRAGRRLSIQLKISNLPAMKLEQLQEFRQLAYECLGQAKDATFELADAAPDDPPRLMFRR